MRITERVVALHMGLERAGIAHAFGGALALAWCTARPRGTVDIDLNVFVPPDRTFTVLSAMPAGVRWDDADRAIAERDGQVRIWWERTPIDLFFNTTPFHGSMAGRIRSEPFEGRELPFLDCRDLAVFKVFFDRGQDWVDLANMLEAGTLDIGAVAGVLTAYLEPDDHRIARLRALDPG